MKKLLVLLFAVALSVTAFAAAVDSMLDTPVNASAYTAGATAVKTIRVLSVDFETGVVRFKLLDAGGVAYGNGAVFGLTDPAITPENMEAKIVALISPQ